MDKAVDFTTLGLDGNTSEFLNWCLKYRDNLETQKKWKVMEIWQQEGEDGTAVLSFNRLGKLLRVNKNLFS